MQVIHGGLVEVGAWIELASHCFVMSNSAGLCLPRSYLNPQLQIFGCYTVSSFLSPVSDVSADRGVSGTGVLWWCQLVWPEDWGGGGGGGTEVPRSAVTASARRPPPSPSVRQSIPSISPSVRRGADHCRQCKVTVRPSCLSVCLSVHPSIRPSVHRQRRFIHRLPSTVHRQQSIASPPIPFLIHFPPYACVAFSVSRAEVPARLRSVVRGIGLHRVLERNL